MIKVLVVVDHATGISGPHRNVVGSLNALSERPDIDLHLLTGKIDEDEPYANRCEIQLGFEPHIIGKLVKNLSLLRKAVSDRDLIYVPTGLKSFLYSYAVKGSRKLIAGPNVSHLPLPWRGDYPGTIELKFMSDIWIEASNARRNHVVQQTGFEEVRVIHHAIDINKFSIAHRDNAIWNYYKIPQDTIKILYIGHDKSILKGVEVLIEAIKIVNSSTTSQEIAFIFAGNLSEKNKIQLDSLDNAYMLGFVYSDKLPTVIASVDISVVPSSWENFPFSVMEAMASGVAIIAGRVGGIPEQIIHGETGMLIDIRDSGVHSNDASTILANAILELAEDVEKRQEYGFAARKRVLTHFTEERLGQDLVDIFDLCLNNN